MEPSYEVEVVRARRQRRITRTRMAAAVASGVTFGAAVAGFAIHDRGTPSSTTSVDATTPTTTLSTGSPFDAAPTPSIPDPNQFTTRSHGS